MFLTGIGAKLAFPISAEGKYTWIPDFSIDIQHDLIGDEVELDSNFLGVSAAAFTTNGANVEQTGYKASLNLRGFGQGRLSFAAGFDYLHKKDYESASFNAIMRYEF